MAARPAIPGDAPTPRETQVAIALLFGHTAEETARELRMGLQTVNMHRYRLYRKFDAEGAGELAAILTGTAYDLPASLKPQIEDTP